MVVWTVFLVLVTKFKKPHNELMEKLILFYRKVGNDKLMEVGTKGPVQYLCDVTYRE